MQCTHCGAALTTEQLRAEDCFYCGKALPHSARAVEKAQVVKELLQDQDGDGVPDIIQQRRGGASGPMQIMHLETSDPVVITSSSVTVSSSSSGEIPEEALKVMEKMGAVWPTGPGSQSRQVRVESVTSTKAINPARLFFVSIAVMFAGLGSFAFLSADVDELAPAAWGEPSEGEALANGVLGATEAHGPSVEFRSVTQACSISANEDGIDDVLIKGFDRHSGQIKIGILDGSTRQVIWAAEESDGDTRIHCLSPHWFTLSSRTFDFTVHPAMTPDRPFAVRASDRLWQVGIGDDCVRYQTEDNQTGGLSLSTGEATACEAPVRSVSAPPPHVQMLTRYESSFRDGNRTYTLSARRRGTRVLSVAATDGVSPIWSRDLAYKKPRFSTAIVSARGRVALVGTRIGDETLILIGLDADTGAEVYATPTRGDRSADFMHFNGRELLVQLASQLCAFDLATGTESWCVGS